MDIQHTYEVYQKQQANIHRTKGWGKPIVLVQFRKVYKGFSQKNVQLLISFLEDDEKKWFVADLLNVLESFPEDLLKPMLLTAVKEPDPSFNNEFVKPCRRIFDYLKIQDILLDLFEHGDKNQKIGVLRVYYWARPLVHERFIYQLADKQSAYNTDFTEIRTKGIDRIIWNNKSRTYEDHFHFEENIELYNEVYPAQKRLYVKRTLRLIAEFFQTKDVELKYYIALALPKELKDFPEEIQQESVKFLMLKEKQGIPGNALELEIVKQKSSPIIRRILLKLHRLKSRKRLSTKA